LYPSLGLSRAIFFARESFGRDALVSGDPGLAADEGQRSANGKPIAQFVAGFPISPASKAQILSLYDRARDPLPGKSDADNPAVLNTPSYRDYLTRICGLSEEAANSFQVRTLGFFGLGCDAVPAADTRELGYPGFAGLGLPGDRGPEWSEPYIYHFPDGNASLTRLLVRALIPAAAPGTTRDDVGLAPCDDGALAVHGGHGRSRLRAT